MYANRVVSLLSSYGDLRSTLPPGFASSRAEYDKGIPAVSNFFFLPPFARALRDIRGSAALSSSARKKIETELGESIDFISVFLNGCAPSYAEGGGLHDRTEAIPIIQCQEVASDGCCVAGDNLRHWEIEDATVIICLATALLSYAEAAASGSPSLAMMRYPWSISAADRAPAWYRFRRCTQESSLEYSSHPCFRTWCCGLSGFYDEMGRGHCSPGRSGDTLQCQ
jgi:hypothetical protein